MIPQLVSAVRVSAINGAEADFEGVNSEDEKWLAEAMAKNVGEDGGLWVIHDGLRIGTPEGVLRVAPGDWIVRGIRGELYPVKHAIFERSFQSDGH